MNILIVGLNYSPEPVGIGPYTAGMARWLVESGHSVTVVCGKPYYPAWKVDSAYAGGGIKRSVEDGVNVIRLPIYVPNDPNGRRRLLHHASFAARALPVVLAEGRKHRPDVVIGIAPSLVSLTAARAVARASSAKFWIHVQDFEVEAAFATGLLSSNGHFAKQALRFEKWNLKADRVSTISPQMCAKLQQKGIKKDSITELRNWADIENVKPLETVSLYREKWGVTQKYVALYSGNIANKQGLGTIIAAAEMLKHRSDLIFIICGEGPTKKDFVRSALHLSNVLFHDLQPRTLLNELLGMADIHLLPQIAGAADLVLPSKLTNMLASGRPIVAAAEPATGVAEELAGCGLIADPNSPQAFARAIEALIDDDPLRIVLGKEARRRAEEIWSREKILGGLSRQLNRLIK